MTLLFSSVLHNFFLLLKIYRIINFFGKLDWSMNSGPQWAGDSYGYKKKLFTFSKRDKKW